MSYEEEAYGSIPAGLAGRSNDDLTYGPQNGRKARGATAGGRDTTGRRISRAGHVIQFNDTEGHESIVIQHADGRTSLVMNNNGTMSIEGEQLSINIGQDATITITGNAVYNVDGNMNFNVSGDMNMNCSRFNLNTSHYNETIRTSRNSMVRGPRREVTTGTHTMETVGSMSATVLGSYNMTAKGESIVASENRMYIASGSQLRMSSETTASIAAPSVNVTAASLSMLGTSGYIGGPAVHHVGLEMEATTFWGDLKGTAEKAITADKTNSQLYSDFHGDVGAAQGYELNLSDVRPTAPSSQQIDGARTTTDKGILTVSVDPNGDLAEQYLRNQFNGDLADGELTLAEIINLSRDGRSDTVISNYVAEGVLGTGASRVAPPRTGRTAGAKPTGQYVDPGSTGGNGNWVTPPELSIRRKFAPPVDYLITEETSYVGGTTTLFPGIRLSRFFVNAGDDTRTNDRVLPQQTGYAGRQVGNVPF